MDDVVALRILTGQADLEVVQPEPARHLGDCAALQRAGGQLIVQHLAYRDRHDGAVDLVLPGHRQFVQARHQHRPIDVIAMRRHAVQLDPLYHPMDAAGFAQALEGQAGALAGHLPARQIDVAGHHLDLEAEQLRDCLATRYPEHREGVGRQTVDGELELLLEAVNDWALLVGL